MEPLLSISRRTLTLVGLLALCIGIMALTGTDRAYWGVFVAAAFGAGAMCVLIWRRGDVSMPVVIGLALAFRLAFVWMPPALSDDAYRYVWDGYLQAEGVNPYLYTPDDAELAAYNDEAVFDSLNSRAYYSVYPPLSQLIFRAGAAFYDHGWEVSYYVIKGIFAALEFGAVLVLSQLVSPAALILYAWNPVVLIAGAGQAHGESALVLFLALTLWSAQKGKGGWASVSLAAAAWIKLYPFVLFPFLWRRFGWRSVVAGGAAAVLIAAPYAEPSAASHMLESLDLYVRLFEFNAGFYYAVKEIFEVFTGADWSKQIGPAFRLAFAASLPAIYALDWRFDWSLRRGFVVTVGAFFLLSTTIHPWYLLAILVLVAPSRRVAWHWHWVALTSIGTYLLYIDGPYWVWVILGWTGWVILGAWKYHRNVLDELLRRRARSKAALLGPFLSRHDRILDLGAGEGFVSEQLVRQIGVKAELADVVDMNRTELPHRVYDGKNLPYADDVFDAVILVYVLHHAEDARRVLEEAVRVSRRRVVILESTYARSWERAVLEVVDRFVNRLRSRGGMGEGSLRFRTTEQWIDLFDRLGVRVRARRDLGGFIHHRTLFILDAAERGSSL